MDIARLSEPFLSSQIHWRVGATNIKDGKLKWGEKPLAIPLAYLDARDVMDRLDKVCGPTGWQSKHEWAAGNKVQCSIGILCQGNAEFFFGWHPPQFGLAPIRRAD